MNPKVVLGLGHADSSGASGLTADTAVYAALGLHSTSVVTAICAQDSYTRDVTAVPHRSVLAQLEAACGAMQPDAIKVGLLGSAETLDVIAERLGGMDLPLVVDPIFDPLHPVASPTSLRAAYLGNLIPRAAVITPDVQEAAYLLGRESSPARMAEALTDYGCSVVVTGGLSGTDWLAVPGARPVAFSHAPVMTSNVRGAGSVLSASLAALLAEGRNIAQSVRGACDYTSRRIQHSSDWELTRGRGPVSHLIGEAVPPKHEVPTQDDPVLFGDGPDSLSASARESPMDSVPPQQPTSTDQPLPAARWNTTGPDYLDPNTPVDPDEMAPLEGHTQGFAESPVPQPRQPADGEMPRQHSERAKPVVEFQNGRAVVRLKRS